MLVTLMVLALAAPPQAPGGSSFLAVRPNEMGSRTMLRFRDNDARTMVQLSDIANRDRLRQAAMNNARRHEAHRLRLADRLDGLIGSGRCADAEGLAASSPYADIADEVRRVCSASPAA